MGSTKNKKIVFIYKRTLAISVMVVTGFFLFSILLFHWLAKIPVNIFSDPYNGVIIIDPGHGGIDGGTAKGGVLEKEVNLDISMRIKIYLEQKGYSVILTREDDNSLDSLVADGSSRHLRDLKARSDLINASNAQMYLSIHTNCHMKNVNASGSIIFYNNKFEQNKALAYCLQRKLNNMIIDDRKRTIRDPQTAEFYLLKYCNRPGVIVETAFISNEQELQLLKTDEFKDGIAKAVSSGVDEYLNIVGTKKKV